MIVKFETFTRTPGVRLWFRSVKIWVKKGLGARAPRPGLTCSLFTNLLLAMRCAQRVFQES